MSTATFSGGIVVVYDLPTLAKSINQEHRNVLASGRSMLEHAIRAGVILRQAKADLKKLRASDPALPVFKEWVPAATGLPYSTAAQYMKAEALYAEKGMDIHTFEGGLHAFLGYDKPSAPHPTPHQPLPGRRFPRPEAPRPGGTWRHRRGA